MNAATLAEIFVTVATFEHELETLRLQLASIPGFEPYCSFKRLDRLSKGYITAEDLGNFLGTIDLQPQTDRLSLLIKTNYHAITGRMSLDEFTRAVLPRSSSAVRDKVLSRPSYAYLAKEAEMGLQGLLSKELEELEYIVSRCVIKTASEDALFRLISPSKRPISSSNVYEFLVYQRCPVTNEDVEAVVRRFDYDMDQFISFNDFLSVSGCDSTTRQPSETELDQKVPSKSKAKTTHNQPSMTKGGILTKKLKNDPYMSPRPTIHESDPSELTRSSDRAIRNQAKSQHSTPMKVSKVTHDISPARSSYKQILVPDCSEVLHQCFSEQLYALASLEQSKEELIKFADFNPYLVFRQFDSKGNGQVSLLELEDTLESLGVKSYRDEVYMLLRAYSPQRDGILNYRAFLKILTPRLDYSYEDSLETELKSDEIVSASTHSKTCEHFRKILEAERLFEGLRQRLSGTLGYSNHIAFQKIDLDRDGFISKAELEDMLGEHIGLEVMFERMDRDGDGRVSFADFVEEWTQRSPRPM